MTKIEKQSEARIIDLNELFPDIERMPVSSKLRTYLRQLSLEISQGNVLENNPYLARLVTESSLFLPEMFTERWVKHWEYRVAIALENSWVSSSLDFAVNREDEVLVIDWSGIGSDRIAVSQAYLISQKLDLEPKNVSVVSLIANPLNVNEDRRINFIRRLFEDNDFYICQQELSERLVLLVRGEDLNPELELKEFNPLLDIETIPEIVID